MMNCFANFPKADLPFSTVSFSPHNSAICFFSFSTAGVDLFRISPSLHTFQPIRPIHNIIYVFFDRSGNNSGKSLEGNNLLSGIKNGTFIFCFSSSEGCRFFGSESSNELLCSFWACPILLSKDSPSENLLVHLFSIATNLSSLSIAQRIAIQQAWSF